MRLDCGVTCHVCCSSKASASDANQSVRGPASTSSVTSSPGRGRLTGATSAGWVARSACGGTAPMAMR